MCQMALSGLDADAPDTSETIIARAWSGRDGDQIIRDIDTGEAGWAAWLHMQKAPRTLRRGMRGVSV